MSPDYIDAHAHVNFNAYESDRDEVIRRALDQNTWMINVGTQKDTSEKAIEIAEQYERGVYAIIGLHPVHTATSYHDEKELGEGGKEFVSRGETWNTETYKKMLAHPKVVGIGECGLDYYRLDPESHTKQRNAFLEQIAFANEAGKPLMLHIRNGEGGNAYKDAADMLAEYAHVKGNVHFFAGSTAEAQQFLDLGFTLSFTGVITFARQYTEVVSYVPLDMILSETDCPYVTPVPYRGKRNEPSYVKEVVQKIADVKGIEESAARAQIVENARRVFGI
jgi:TatD DNase family protein